MKEIELKYKYNTLTDIAKDCIAILKNSKQSEDGTANCKIQNEKDCKYSGICKIIYCLADFYDYDLFCMYIYILREYAEIYLNKTLSVTSYWFTEIIDDYDKGIQERIDFLEYVIKQENLKQ